MQSINPIKKIAVWFKRTPFFRLEHWLDRLALAIILLFFMSGVLTLPRYGLTWDEGLGNLFFGERYADYLTTFQEKFLDFRSNLQATSHLPLDLTQSPLRDEPYSYPPLMDTVSAASMQVLAYQWHWMDPVDAFHFPKIVLTAIFLWFFYQFFIRRVGRPAAFLGLLFLATFPRLWGDMHFNPKDVPEMAWIGMAVMAYVNWYEHPHWGKAFGVGILFATALATKVNAVFIPFILVLGVWPWNLLHPRTWLDNLFHLKKYFFHYVFMVLSTVFFYYISWPNYYKNPWRALDYFKEMSSQGGRTGIMAWNWEPLLQVFSTTPEVMLFCLCLGLCLALFFAWKKPELIWRLCLVWFLFPIFRICLPGMVNFDGIRHFLEFLPAAAILAGIGAFQLVKWLTGKYSRRQFLIGTLLVFFIGANTTELMLRYFPYEYIYYNHLAGGLAGAKQIFPADEATDYWAVSYREGLQWINQNAGSGARLYVPVAGYLVDETRRIWLRSDIQILPDKSDLSSSPQNETYVMFILRPGFYKSICNDLINKQTPVHQVIVDGQPVMAIYRYPLIEP